MKTFLTILSGSLLAGALTACSSDDAPVADDKVIPGNETVEEGEPVEGVNKEQTDYTLPDFPDKTIYGKILSLPESAKGVSRAANAFAVDMFRTLSEQTGDNNIATAPFSVFTALAMAANGDSGQTRESIVNRLGNGKATLEELNTFSSAMMEQLANLDGGVWCMTANSLWVNGSGDDVNAGFSNTLNEVYNASLYARDFGTDDVRSEINRWIENHTYGFIKDFLYDDVCGEAALINTIYFKGLWSLSFYEPHTAAEPFHNLDGSMKEVPTMHQSERLGVSFDNDVTTLLLPFGEEDHFVMTVMMPADNLENFVNTLTAEKIAGFTESAGNNRILVDLSFPKFESAYKNNIVPCLTALGLGSMFVNGFDSMLTSLVTVNAAVHGAQIKIDEKGTEAAGATANFSTSSPGTPLQWTVVNIDHPFVYTISEVSTGTILFMGEVTNL